MTSDDAQIAERASQGDRDAFRMLVERHASHVFQVCYRITGRQDRAEDAVQETFISAYKALPRFQARSRFSTWLHRIAVNAALQVMRREHGWDERASDGDAVDEGMLAGSDVDLPERRADSEAAGDAASAALDALTPMERAAFTLRHFEGSPIAEVAGQLGIAESAAKQAVFRAVRKMRVALEPYRLLDGVHR